VAVIDNGVDINHEDLKNVIWTNEGEFAGNGVDDDHNGYIDDIHGWNFRSGKDGSVVENEMSASTQLYLAWRKRFEGADILKLTRKDANDFKIYQRAKNDFDKRSSARDSVEQHFTYNINYNSSALIANDGNISGKTYGSPNATLSNNLSHGTHVAGIIAAQRSNGKGIDGIADHVLIMPLLATTAAGDERDKDVANAILYAVDNGAQVINMSFSKLFSPEKYLVDAAIRHAERRGVLIVHAAGNDGVDIDNPDNYHYPVADLDDGHKATNFITVGWSRELFNYRLAHPRSNYGFTSVDLFAPGSDIFSATPNDEYGSKSGSSMSAPMVSGVAALLLAYFPSLSAAQVKDILLKSSFKPDQVVNKPGTSEKVAFKSLSVSGGIVNAFFAIRLALGEK
jgi:subtilisin family serine protease